MADLKTTYQDDVLDTSVNEKRKYNMIQNADGTVSFEDVTTYSQNGDSFGAADINATNKKVNEVNSNLESKVDSLSGEYTDEESATYTALSVDGVGYDEENNQLLLKVNGADSVIPFKKDNNMFDFFLNPPSGEFTLCYGYLSGWLVRCLSNNVTFDRVFYNQTSAVVGYLSETCTSTGSNWTVKTYGANIHIQGYINGEYIDQDFPDSGSVIISNGNYSAGGTFFVAYKIV